ncbi:MAG: hypothetical protein KAJ86_05720, partial [Alphaproteobacteria bacterium]|nr:hypothetical protein [Alphaproteobacteria bacterium]
MVNPNTQTDTQTIQNNITDEHITISKPEGIEVSEVILESGQNYIFDFAKSEVKAFAHSDGDLTITFKDGASLILKNYTEATQADVPSVFSFNSVDGIVEMLELTEVMPSEDELEEPQAEIREMKDEIKEIQAEFESQQVSQIEPAAGEDVSQNLANIAPDAGDMDASVSNSGYGIGSSFKAQGVIPVNDLGPIDPTILNYGVEFHNDEVFPQKMQAPQTPNYFPEIADPDDVRLDESNLAPLVQNGQIDFDFGDDGPGHISANNSFVVGGSLLGGDFTSGGVDIVVTSTSDGYVGVSGNVIVFEWLINQQTGEYVYNQYEPFDHADATDPNDEISLEFGITVTDVDGDSVSTTATVYVADDNPLVLSQNEKSIDETDINGGSQIVTGNFNVDFGQDISGEITVNGGFTASGSIAGGALTSGGVPVVVTSTATGYVGMAGVETIFILNVNPSTGAYEFTQYGALDHADGANPNDVITLEFGMDVTDFDGDSDNGNITINIIDDAPIAND